MERVEVTWGGSAAPPGVPEKGTARLMGFSVGGTAADV